ncbi:hypothetical protein CRM22_005227 [Opisthorchis felineus]|uniref:Uncharacterized protein n=1 Tax=Opisthorchis felineus TaxID=147828 RepID=A0A4S2LS77_OPIFE|nr:hypothetical protein CRM22_005227 [Opisthorchis felineus]
MHVKQSRPLFWLCVSCTTFGLLCSFFALILPYWYARFPQSKNRFLSLGLWEICLEKFMPDDLGNAMYDGCFSLYDWHVKPLWPIIWRTWFVVCQAFATCSFIALLLAEVTLVTQACRLISHRGPRAVLFVMIVCGISCLCILISLITMGVGVDDESKRVPVLERNWLQGLDQCTLSWSYGLTAVSFPGCFLTLVVLCWFVYPKRSTKGLLSVAAWEWPTVNDWTCRYHLNDLRTSGSRSYSNPSRSVVSSGEERTRSGVSEPEPAPRPTLTFRQPLVSATPSASHSRSHRPSRTEYRHIQTAPNSALTGDMASPNVGKLSSYDPRSPDTVSLLSYEQPPPVARLQSPSNTVEEQSSIRTEDSNTRSFLLTSRSYRNGIPEQEDIGDWRRLPSPHHSSVATEAPHGSAAVMPSPGQQPKFMSSHSALDTSIWTVNSPSETTQTHPPVQAARRMRRNP